MKKIILPLALLVSSASVYAETSPLKGQLLNDNGKPISNAEIHIRTLDVSVTTDEQGNFSFDALDEGRYVLDIEAGHDGHMNRSVTHDGSKLVVSLDPNDTKRIVITGNPLEHSMLDMAAPSTVIAGDELVENRGANIGETLSEIPGINLSSFGSGAGRPVIRGQQGNRVKVLSNNSSTQDAANASPDHWISAEPLLAERVEVLKGPATLLYGGSAIGGAVNVVDKKIPNHRLDTVEGGFETRLADSTTGEFAMIGSLTAGHDNWAAHVEAFSTHSDDITIPGFAESEALRHSEEHDEHEEDDHDEDHDEHDEHEEEAYGLLENSAVKAHGGAVGFSYFTDSGHIGVSFSEFNRTYGIPVHAHGEEHEEHEEDHDDDHDDEHEDEHEEHDEHEEDVVLALKQQRFDLKGEWQNLWSSIEQTKLHFSRTNYKHTEFEGDETGTVFENEAYETRLEFVHTPWAEWHGAFGLQHSKSDFQAVGEESFIPRSKTENLGFFWLEEQEFDSWHLELGARFDQQTISSPLGQFAKQKDNAFSAAIGAVWRISPEWTLPINIAHAERLPSTEELFSNHEHMAGDYVPHLATFTIEVGDSSLNKETSQNFDIGLRYHTDELNASFSLFHNKIDDYIFLDTLGDEQDEFPVFYYSQEDTLFEGAELEVDWLIAAAGETAWNVGFFADYTHAERASGAYLPRVPSKRFGLNLGYQHGDWNYQLKAINVAKQDKLSLGEFATDGYTQLNASMNYTWYLDNADVLFFLRANNLLDEEIRDHSSFIKDYAPRAGQAFSAGFRVTF